METTQMFLFYLTFKNIKIPAAASKSFTKDEHSSSAGCGALLFSSPLRLQFMERVRSENPRGDSVNFDLRWGVSKNQMPTLCHLILIS